MIHVVNTVKTKVTQLIPVHKIHVCTFKNIQYALTTVI